MVTPFLTVKRWRQRVNTSNEKLVSNSSAENVGTRGKKGGDRHSRNGAEYSFDRRHGAPQRQQRRWRAKLLVTGDR